jgi:hypothetical protein
MQTSIQEELDQRNQANIKLIGHIKSIKRFNQQITNDFTQLKQEFAQNNLQFQAIRNERSQADDEKNVDHRNMLSNIQELSISVNSLMEQVNQMKNSISDNESTLQLIHEECGVEADTRNKTDMKLNSAIRDLKSTLQQTMKELGEIRDNADYNDLRYNLESEMNKRSIADASLLEEIAQAKKWLADRLSEQLDQVANELTAKNTNSFSVQLQQEMMEESNKRNASDASILNQLESVHKNLTHQFTTEVESLKQTFAQQLHGKLAKAEQTRDAINQELAAHINSIETVANESITEFHERIDKMDQTLRGLVQNR